MTRIVTVDAFTDRPFAGNPAAVCVLDAPRPESWMQDVAREMNLSETAFLHPTPDGWQLRWFTPTTEIPLCGHATLASAHVLWENGHDDAPTLKFLTKSGALMARRDGTLIELDFPTDVPATIAAPEGLATALGTRPLEVLRAKTGILAVLPDAGTVRKLTPDLAWIQAQQVQGVIVTSPGDAGFDYACRYFVPALGIPEDPVTGAIQCALGPYWAGRLSKPTLMAQQVSARGGVLRVRPDGTRVRIAGHAVTTVDGVLRS